MDRTDHDVIIIGTGAGGGTLAHRLASSGKRILLLERGGFLPREKLNWNRHALYFAGRYKTDEQWFDRNGQAFGPKQYYGVGGNTKVYGAVMFRMRERDFGEVAHRDGVSPAWPISYAELAPWYHEAEQLYRVRGHRGEDPLDPPDPHDYDHPAISHEPRIAQLSDDLERMGLHPFHLPMGVQLIEGDREASPCIRCDTCDGFPCMVDAKSDAHVIAVRPALAHDNVDIITGARADRLLTDDSGRTVTGVEVVRDGEREVHRADVVVVSCGAVNSAALLLRSATDRHPDGLANGSGVVGRHYMAHLNTAFFALSRSPNPTRFPKTLGLNDFYEAGPDGGPPLGHIQLLGPSDAEMVAGPLATLGIHDVTPEYAAEHALEFWLQTEDLPVWDNRVVLGEGGRIEIHQTPTNVASHRRLIAELEGLLDGIDCEAGLVRKAAYTAYTLPISGTAHQCGTVRFGGDPATSALDLNCRAHELDNLYVVDASFFPSSSAVNPSLTVIANALRVGDHLLDRLGATAPAMQFQEVAP